VTCDCRTNQETLSLHFPEIALKLPHDPVYTDSTVS